MNSNQEGPAWKAVQNFRYETPPIIKDWRVARPAMSNKYFDAAIALCVATGVVIFTFNPFALLENEIFSDWLGDLFKVIPAIWLATKSPDIHMYRITLKTIESVQWQWLPKWLVGIGAAVGVVYFFVLLNTALDSGSGHLYLMIFLYTVIVTRALLAFLQTEVYRGLLAWQDCHLFTIDRKRKVIVAGRIDLEPDGFEIIVRSTKDIDPLVNILKVVAPHAEFREGDWNWLL